MYIYYPFDIESLPAEAHLHILHLRLAHHFTVPKTSFETDHHSEDGKTLKLGF